MIYKKIFVFAIFVSSLHSQNFDLVTIIHSPSQDTAHYRYFGSIMRGGGDFNGDGVMDLIANTKLGSFVFYGGTFPDINPSWSINYRSIPSYGHDARFLRDMNGDGYDEVGIFFKSDHFSPAELKIYFGGENADTIPDLCMHYPWDWGAHREFFCRGDINGDGYGDLVVDYGYIYYGGPNMDTLPDFYLPSSGIYVSEVDYNGDGYMDVIATFDSSLPSGEGAVYFGGPTMDDIPDVKLRAWNFHGSTKIIPLKLDHDQYEDFISIDSDLLHGYFIVYYWHSSPSDTLITFDDSLNTRLDVICMPTCIPAVGDFNGDGIDDIAMKVYADSNAPYLYQRYAIWTFFSGPGFDSIPDLVINDDEAFYREINNLTGLRDYTGDGHDKLAISYKFSHEYPDYDRNGIIAVYGQWDHPTPYLTLPPADPNPPYHEIMQGGMGYHYYLLTDSTGTNLSFSWLTVGFQTQDTFYLEKYLQADEDGIIQVPIDAEKIGEPGDSAVGYVTSVVGAIPSDSLPFDVRVTDRRYFRALYYTRGEGGSAEVLGVDLGGWVNGSTFLGYISKKRNPDSLVVGRTYELGLSGGASAGGGVEVSLNGNTLGGFAGAGVTGYTGGFSRDEYRFHYPLDSLSDQIAALALFFDPRPLILEPTTQMIYTALIGGLDLMTLNNHVVRKGGGIFTGVNASAGIDFGIGAPIFYNLLQMGADLSGRVEGRWQAESAADTFRLGTGLIASLQFGAGISGLTFDEPWGENQVTSDLINLINFWSFDAGFDFDGTLKLSSGLETFNDSFEVYLEAQKEIVNGNRGYNEGVVFKFGPFPESLSSILQDVSLLRNLSRTVFDSLGDTLTLNGNTIARAFFEFANQLANISDSLGLQITCETYADTFRTTQLFDISVNIGIEAVSAGFSIQNDLRYFRRILTSKGVYKPWHYYVLEEYHPDNYTSTWTDARNLPGNILRSVPTTFWTQYLSQFVANMPGGDSLIMGLGNGTLHLGEGALGTGTRVGGTIWNWTGDKGVPEENRALLTAIKNEARKSTGFDYGIGGFFRLVPHGRRLNAPSAFEIAYADSEVSGFDESDLKMYMWDEDSLKWRCLGGVIDTSGNRVIAGISELGTFTLAPAFPDMGFHIYPDRISAPADSNTIVHFSTDTVRNNDGSLASSLFTVSTSAGFILNQDADTLMDGVQILPTNGVISFDILAPSLGARAIVRVSNIYGHASGDTTIIFVDSISPQPPSNLSATWDDTTLVLSWEMVSERDVAGYRVYYDVDSSGPPYSGRFAGFPASPIECSDTVYRFPGLDPTDVYYFAVTSYDYSGNESDYSNEIRVSISSNPMPVPTRFRLLSVYPNPSFGTAELSMSIPAAQIINVKVYDIAGRVVRNYRKFFNAGYYRWRINLRSLKAGIYFIRVSGDKQSVRKLILLN